MRRNLYSVLALLLVLFSTSSRAQLVTIATGITSPNWYFYGTPIATMFGINNTNTSQIILMEVDYYHNPVNNSSPYNLYVQTTSPTTGTVTGFPTGWVLIATKTISGTATITNIFQNLNYVVPGGATMRFALQTMGSQFETTSTATPTFSTNGGVRLCTYQNGVADGYTGFGANLNNGPTNFIGIIRFIPGYPCEGKPGPSYIVGPDPVCPNDTFTQRVQSGVGFVLDLEYQWQYSANGTTWNNYVGAGYNTDRITDIINSPKYYRAIVTCKNSGLKDTTPAKYITIAPFYYCYCKSSAADTNGIDIGNVQVMYVPGGQGATIPGGDTILNNGNAVPLYPNPAANQKYNNYQFSGPRLSLFRDSTYEFKVTQIGKASTASSGWVSAYLDWNRDGLYDTVTERVLNEPVTNPLEGSVKKNFKIPSNAGIGLTGFRVVLTTNPPAAPCGGFNDGEVEDYLADIKWEPCSGPVNAGMIEGDTSVCVGYDYLLTDTTYEKRKSAFSRQWLVSGDNISWFNISNTSTNDTLERVFNGQPLFYKMRLVCDPTHDTTYTPEFKVNLKAPYKCYCFSQADGGKEKDSSDIGGFTLATVSHTDGGTHLLNPNAGRKRTDFTDNTPVDMDVDSLYTMTVFHTMKTGLHGDAKITVFMDFNNNNVYDIPEDLIYTGYTSVGNFTVVDSVRVKQQAILNVPTGLRVILNNDIAPNRQSDSACGVFMSGETEDYMIMFRKKGFTGVGTVADAQVLSVYPNPTSGKFMIRYNSAVSMDKVSVVVTSVTGQAVYREQYGVKGNVFTKELDMSELSKGIYFVEITADGKKTTEKLVIK